MNKLDGKGYFLSQRIKALFFITSCAISVDAYSSQVPAQAPLVSWKTMAAPNIMVIFDTSLSMGKSYIPENALNDLTGGSYGSGSGARTTFHPDDYRSSRTPYNGWNGGYKWFVPTEKTQPFAAVMRSPQLNQMYYNPSSYYQPWLKADGTPMNNANPYAAPLTVAKSFVVGTGNTKQDGPYPTVDLATPQDYYFNGSSSSNNPYRRYMIWGTRLDRYTTTTENNVTRRVAPSTYFIYKYGMSRKLEQDNATTLTNLSNYIAISIMEDIGSSGLNISQLYRNAGYNTTDPAAINYIKIERPDCSLTSNGDYICSREQELQNFANWFTYYRSRTLGGLGALTHVLFREYAFNFRYGWTDFKDRSSHYVDGVRSTFIVKGVREASFVHNQDFINWAAETETETDDTTPTRGALHSVGQYFMRTDNLGPWSAQPGDGSNLPQLACRRNFSIIVTDGRWNSTSGISGVIDRSSGPTIKGPEGSEKEYQYQPRAPYIGHRSSSSPLSSTSLYYWYTDLRSDMPNTIEETPGNEAFWQHMVTHVVEPPRGSWRLNSLRER